MDHLIRRNYPKHIIILSCDKIYSIYQLLVQRNLFIFREDRTKIIDQVWKEESSRWIET